ncbi:MAG: cation diffusion facilitator family transporter [Clostridia bacterium]|nr:cation diffusion facilitator family transporter [Clostridia bacterium]
MVTLLAKIFIRKSMGADSDAVRKAYGLLCGALGIAINLVLFAAKIVAGTLSCSIAITADAFNNLSDAGSSVITLFGFIISQRKADSDHPFGHGRVEYICGFIVSLLILLMGVELLKSSIERIITPEPVSTLPVVFVILGISIAAKLYMWFYNLRIGKKINSPSMKATAIDSLSDMLSTAVVLAASLIQLFFKINVDAYCGVLVSLFIFYAGIRSAKETVSPLLGKPTTKEFAEEITSLVLSHEGICGVHDLIVHDYGPNRFVISLHAEVPAHADILQMHDLIDNIERELAKKYNCMATIHMDPIETSDEVTNRLKDDTVLTVAAIDPRLSLHDFRVVSGPTHTNLIFDVVVPHKFALSDKELRERIAEGVSKQNPNCYTVINIERSFIQ